MPSETRLLFGFLGQVFVLNLVSSKLFRDCVRTPAEDAGDLPLRIALANQLLNNAPFFIT